MAKYRELPQKPKNVHAIQYTVMATAFLQQYTAARKKVVRKPRAVKAAA